MEKIKVGSDFSGVGAFDQALNKLGIDYETVFACDMDKYARKTFIANYGEPKYYPENVYGREIPIESLDIYMTSPPCQAFSLAGKRKGESDDRGVLFYNSHEFISKNKPRFFIFENVKGLLSDSSGKTFQRWIDFLGGKSVNGNPVLFPHDESVPYHVYYKVLNAKDFGVPQNRERIFIIGIRDDQDNNFSFPREIPLEKRLRDVLESEVDEKYYLSEKMVNGFIGIDPNGVSRTIRCGGGSKDDKHNWDLLKVGYVNQNTQGSSVYSDESISQTLCAGTHGYANGYIQVKSATSNGYETAKIGAIRGKDPDNPKSRESGLKTEQMLEINENGTSNCLTTVQKDNVVVTYYNPKIKFQLTGGKWDKTHEQSGRVYDENGIAPTIHTMGGVNQEPKISTDYRIRKLTPLECFRLMGFNEDFIEKTINAKKYFYFQFIYSNFATNKKETLCNAKLKVVKEPQTQENLETYVLCTTKECQEMEILTTLRQKKDQKTERKESLKNVSFAIEPLVELEQKECVINITKWKDCTETPCIEIIKKTNRVVVDISDIITEKDFIEPLWKITLEENLSEEKLFITLILLKQIMTSKIFIYAETPPNTPRYINSIVNYEKKLGRLQLSYLRMESTKQLVSDSMLYKQAGNSIVVDVLAVLISKLKL